MRIDRLDLIAYGHFTEKSLNLSDGNSGLHLIYGDNEAGKSTSLRALIALLFGIESNTTDNYIHTYSQLRIGGKLKLSSGKELEFVRRKGTKGTLLKYGTDDPLDDLVLLPFLPSSIDKTLFTKLYGIDHGGLVSGGQELLNQSGDLGQALFSAAVGTADFREILSELQSRAEELFKPRASTKIVNQAVLSFKEAKRRIKDSSLFVAEWKRIKKKIADIKFEIKQVEEVINSKSKYKSRLDRLNRVKGALAERRVVIDLFEKLGKVLLLPEDFDEKYKIGNEKLQTATEAQEKAIAKLSRLKKEAALMSVRYELLENEDAIISILKKLGAVETAISDRSVQDGKRRQLSNEANQLLKSVRPDRNLKDVDKLRPLLNNKKWISDLSQKHTLLTQQKITLETTLRSLEDEQELIQKKLNMQSSSNLDLSKLNAAVVSARKVGDLEQRLADTKKRALDEKSACESEHLRLGRFNGTIEELLKVAMPESETLDIYKKKFDDIDQKIRDYYRKQKELEEEQKETKQGLKALLLISEVPTSKDLKESRLERNKGWVLIRHKYIEKIDVKKDIEKFSHDHDLPTLYEQKVDVADHISDQRCLDADNVVKRADFEAKIENLKMSLDDITEKIEQVNESKKVNLEKWSNVWASLGVDAGTPIEMKEWLFKVDKILAKVQSANTTSGEVKNLSENYDVLKKSISLQIAKFDDSINLQEMNLETMINLCEQRIEQEDSIIESRRQLNYKQSDLDIRIKRTREDLKSIEDDRSNWIQDWGQAINGLGLESNVHPEHATEIFDKFVEFFEKFDKSEELSKRIYGMDQVVEKFKKRVIEFTNDIGFKRDNKDSITIAAQLNRDLNKAREARASLKKIEILNNDIEGEIEDLNITIQSAKEQLTSLRDHAMVKTDDDLKLAIENSKNKHELQKKLQMLDQELMRNGDGLNIQELEKEASESDIDAIENELERISSELKEEHNNRDGLRDQRQTIQNEINAKDGSAEAASASEDAAQHLATLVSDVEQYLHLKIAALILKQQIEEYRKKNQAPILARASELFSRLTLGSFAGLRDELDNGKPILLGVRPSNTEVTVDGMSDGSRDQLYLSLRLATLEEHLGKSEPMPFVVDDILIGFDDNRTKVCLEMLAELSSGTQVLLFTHHKRVIELAKTLKSKSGIFTHELL